MEVWCTYSKTQRATYKHHKAYTRAFYPTETFTIPKSAFPPQPEPTGTVLTVTDQKTQ